MRRAAEVVRWRFIPGVEPDRDLLAAFPLINTPVLLPNAAESNTTIVTYLFTDPTADLFAQNGAAYDYAGRFDPRDEALVGVGGAIPAQIEQGTVIGRELPLVEAVTLAAIAVIVGANFRSVVAPLITLVTAAAGYLLADRAIGSLAAVVGVAAPAELEPIVVALMLGITTDYSIFFLTGMQRRLQFGASDRDAAQRAVQEYLPIVVTAGFTVACGVAALVVAESGLFKELGPGLAVTVLVGSTVAVLLVPALLAVLGRWVFWPGRTITRHTGSEAAAESGTAEQVPRSRMIEFLADRRRAAAVAAGAVLVLVLASSPLLAARSAVAPIASLPWDTRRGWRPRRQAPDSHQGSCRRLRSSFPGRASPTGALNSPRWTGRCSGDRASLPCSARTTSRWLDRWECSWPPMGVQPVIWSCSTATPSARPRSSTCGG